MSKRRLQQLSGSVVLITGGGSGIGLALGTEAARNGANVVLADCDALALKIATERLMEMALLATTVTLDVTDRRAFASVVEDVVAEHGRIDLLINCAGISMGGPTHEMSGEHWDRALDVNLGGVVNGVLAAYPHMIKAAAGHIVNVASVAGLVSPPFVVPYATSKHAVVGLSLALRPEAALHGVQVGVLCPGAVETPILDRLPPPDLPATPTEPVSARAYLSTVGQSPMDADVFAKAALRRIVRNQPVIIVPRQARVAWWLNRLLPTVTLRAMKPMAAKVQRDLLRSRERADSHPLPVELQVEAER